MQYLLTTIIFFISSSLFASNITQATDSLLQLLKNNHSTEKRIQIYRNLADLNFDTPNNKMYLLQMYKEALKIDDKESILSALNDILIEEINETNYCQDSVVKYINRLKESATKEELRVLLPYYHMRMFDALCYIGKNEEAINKELEFISENSDSTEDIYKKLASTYNISSGLYMTGQYEKSIPYLNSAISIAESLPEKNKNEYLKLVTRRLCFAYGRTGRHKESLSRMENLIKIVEQNYKTNYQKQRPFYKIELYLLQYYSYMICGIAHLTIEQENYYWKRIQEIKKKLINDIDKYNYYLCANNYYANNHTKIDLPKSIAANDSLIKFAETLAPRNLSGLYNTGSLLYEKSEDYQNALKYLRISHQIKDSLNSDDAEQQLNELQVKYDINTLNNENAKLELKNKKTLLISLSILLIIVVTICTYLYFSLKKEKRMKMELNILHRKAQESEMMKQSFINSICHEIRTPLNAIVGFSDLIMNEDIDAEMRREFPAEIQKSTKLLTNLVNSMLEVANLDVSEEKLPCESTDIRSICIQEMEQMIQKPDILYKLDITEETMMITTNVQYLTIVIEHLLSNANKFTEKGQITLGYTINEKQDKISINVTDTGCGIPKDKYEEVFNRFSKLDTFVPGNGLGLYLCRLIVKRLNGEIKIDPNYTEGTRMIVTLPII